MSQQNQNEQPSQDYKTPRLLNLDVMCKFAVFCPKCGTVVFVSLNKLNRI
jgi:hypothetical protein